MEKELKEMLETSKETLEKIEKKVSHSGKDVSEDIKGYWKELKAQLEDVSKKLKGAYVKAEGKAELQSHLLLMEMRERMEKLKDNIDTFAARVTHKSEEELDILALKAHLAKMDAEDAFEEKEKELSHLYAKSKVEVERLAQKALHEINEVFVKLTEIV